ncbi:MAG: hypothetical protein QNJ22_03400 [Desulfosarcinaceae bacterium]|nr:hypothetical protein [Desulfosarcinaceae bacterium]
MIIQPAIVALFIGSGLVCLMLLFAIYYGAIILRRWDLHSGSEQQLVLERRTYLISTLVTYAFAFQLIAAFLFIYTTDHLHSLFIGAMCAAGTLNVNVWGYPTVLLKVFNCIAAGLWLILNVADNRAHDYPLIRIKYGLLLLLSPFFFAEFLLQGAYFLGLEPDVITSCCGSLFSSEREDIVAGLTGLPRIPMQWVYHGALAMTLAAGIYLLRTHRGAIAFGALSLAAFLVAIAAIISFISLYIYELPTHHCPFCILQREYHYIGYALYATLLLGTIAGLGAGVLHPCRSIKSLAATLPGMQRQLVIAAITAFAGFGGITTYCILTSRLSFS